MLARYDPQQQPVVAALGISDDDDITVQPVQIAPGATLGDLTASIRDRLAAGLPGHEPPSPGAPSPAAAAAAGPGGLAVTAGLVFEPGSDEPGLATERLEYRPCLAPPFPLTITLARAAGGLELCCHYLRRRVSPSIAVQFTGHLVHVHRQVTGTPGRPAADAELLDQAERERVRALGRPARPAASWPRRLEDIFGDRAAEQPEAVALSDDDVMLTYRELDEWSNRLAGGLRQTGVRDGDLVGVCLERSAELVAILLAILEAGAVYVPLDPAYPAERLGYMVANSGLGVLVTRRTDFPGAQQLRVITPARAAELGADHSGRPPERAGSAADPAYVIYTSGSTGRPKGVLVPHRNVTSLLAATARGLRARRRDDVWTLFHSSAFDFSVWEIWGCLLTGGRLVVVPYWVSRSPERVPRPAR